MGNSCTSHPKKITLLYKRPSDLKMNMSDLENASMGPFITERCIQKKLVKWLRMRKQCSKSSRPFVSYLSEAKRAGKFLRRVKKGPPGECRWEVWQALAHFDRCPSVYIETPLGDISAMNSIERDLHRTFPSHKYFDLQEYGHIGVPSLKQVLGKLAAKRPDIGYCQSMNFLAGFILLVSGGDEAGTFAMMEVLMADYKLCEFYNEHLSGLKKEMWIFQQLLETHENKVARHLDKMDVLKDQWVLQWFISLYTVPFNSQVAIRVWDCFLIDRFSFLHKMALSIISKFSQKILEMDTSQICEFFRDIGKFVDEEVVKDAIKIEIDYWKFNALEKIYTPRKGDNSVDYTQDRSVNFMEDFIEFVPEKRRNPASWSPMRCRRNETDESEFDESFEAQILLDDLMKRSKSCIENKHDSIIDFVQEIII